MGLRRPGSARRRARRVGSAPPAPNWLPQLTAAWIESISCVCHLQLGRRISTDLDPARSEQDNAIAFTFEQSGSSSLTAHALSEHSMRLHLFGCLLCILASFLTPARGAEFAPDPASVQREGPGYRYPQAGWIVV